MKNIIQIIFLLISLYSFGQRYEVGEEMYVIADGGLNLRKKPSFDEEIITLLNRGSKVKIDQILKSEEIELPNGYRGKWVKILYGNKEGFVFDAYLSRLIPIDFLDIDKNGCWKNDILKEWALNIGKLDSIEYDRYGDGEGTYRMMIFQLKNGGKYIEHYYWEHLENEIQLFGLKVEEIDQFVLSIMGFCEGKREELEIVGKNKQRYIDIKKYEDCCVHNLRIKVIDDKLIIRTQIDPGS